MREIHEKVNRKSGRFALTDYLVKEYNKPINTNGVIRIYPDVTKKKKEILSGTDKHCR